MKEKQDFIKGRGAQKNVQNRFESQSGETLDEYLNYCAAEGDLPERNRTHFQEVFPKTIVNKVPSPDVSMAYSLNAYQGCEHGCIYCFARNSHEYWGFNAGLDFERQILVKKNAAELLEAHLLKKSWKPWPIVMSGNTDCYQPAERTYKLTRACLEVFAKYRHPVGIITKNALILRDLDLLESLAKDRLVRVNFSVTTLSEKTRLLVEPRTASIPKRLDAIRQLSARGIPVNVMLAPLIPGINSHEILPMAKAVADAGAVSISHTVVRLNGAIAEVFTDWIRKAMPDRADKVLNQIASCHGGTLNDSRWGNRIKGDGPFAVQMAHQMQLARRKFFSGRAMPEVNLELFERARDPQLRLF